MLGKRAAKATEVPMVALVIEAEDPLDNRITFGGSSRGTVRILIDAEPDPIYVARDLKLDRDHWLVPGMQLPVMIDPAHPDRFEIRWDQIPSMAQRAAANDPTLADPVATKKRTQQALLASGAVGPAGPYRPSDDVRDFVVKSQAEAAAQGDTRPDHWQESLERAAAAPAPPGKMRAVILFAASEATLRTEGGTADGQGGSSGGTQVRERHGTHDVVLAVTVPAASPTPPMYRSSTTSRARGSRLVPGSPPWSPRPIRRTSRCSGTSFRH